MRLNKDNSLNNLDIDKLPARKWLFFCALFSLLFLCYGSLVPLDYQYKPLTEAWTSFVTILSEGFQVRSRADLGENFLLMVPVGFFGMGALWSNDRRKWILPLAMLLFLGCLASSFTIEFMQTFFRGRTPSLSDIFMQTMGALGGIIGWCLWGHKVWTLFFKSASQGRTVGRYTKILWVYLLVLIGYNLVPLDVTINPYSIYHKYKAGRIILVPFGFHYSDSAEFIYALITDILIWVPVGFFWCLAKSKKVAETCFWALTAVVALEVAQIFISSRIFDITDIILVSIGVGGGILLFLKLPLGDGVPRRPNSGSYSEYRMTWLGILLFFLWLFFLALIFWFPFDVLIERKFIESQLNRFFQVPFHVYYYSGGLTALTSVLRKTLFFMPLGIFAFIAYRPLKKFGVDSLLFLIVFLCFLGAGTVIELGQALMPNKIPDSTDLLFETIGGVCGFCMTNYFIKRSER